MKVLETINSENFCDYTPHEIHARLADKGEYVCSPSTMYRLLKKENLNVHRGRAKAPENRLKIETKAMKPNEVWCWDITYLPTAIRGKYLKLYVFEDLYSRKIIGSHIDEHENEIIALKLLQSCIEKEKITGQGLRIHSDNGNPMKGYFFLEKMRGLGIVPSRSRPRVSNDNPYIESLFKTMKYRPEYPYRPFRDIVEANVWVAAFIKWYNYQHLHSGIGYITPDQRHQGLDLEVFTGRNEVLKQAKLKTPWRWNLKLKQWKQIEVVELNEVGCRVV